MWSFFFRNITPHLRVAPPRDATESLGRTRRTQARGGVTARECERIGVAGGLLRLKRVFIPSLKGLFMELKKVDVKAVCVEVDLA